MNCSANDLIQASRCFRCIPPGSQREVQIYLLCQWASNPNFCGTPSDLITLSGAGDANANGLYTKNGVSNGQPRFENTNNYTITWSDSLIATLGMAWLVQNNNADVLYYTSPALFPCRWNVYTVDIPSPPAPTGVYSAIAPPAAPTIQPATLVGGGIATGNWLASAGATGYFLDVSTSNVFASFVPGYNNLSVGNVTSFLIQGLSGLTQYFYRVRAFNGATSANSGTANFTTATDIVGDWATRATNNGGTPTANTKLALNKFYANLIDKSLDTKMIAVCCLVPDDLPCALTPLIKVRGYDPWVNHNFVAGDLTVNGLVGNGTTKFLDTGVFTDDTGPGTGDNSLGLSVYNVTTSNRQQFAMGAGDAGTNTCYLAPDYQFVSYWANLNNGASQISAANANWTGFCSGNRISSTSTAIYIASSGHAFSTLVSSITPRGGTFVGLHTNFYAFAHHGDTLTQGPSSDRYSFFAEHIGLTIGQCQNLYNAVQALRIDLGGGFV